MNGCKNLKIHKRLALKKWYNVKCFFQIMAVFYPHQVDIQKAGPSFDSTRGGTRSTASSTRQTALLDKADLHDKIIQTSAIK